MRCFIAKKALFVLCLSFSFLIMNDVLASISVKAITGIQDNSIASSLRKNAQATQKSKCQSEVTPDLASKFISRHSFDNRLSSETQAEALQKEVRIVYLAPSDKVIRPEYTTAIRNAIVHLQAFYQSQLGGGYTFSLHSPIVETYQTNHLSAFYSSGQNASTIGFFSSVLNDGFALSGGAFNDPNYRWIYYVDADTACGQAVGAASGVALLPANDLRGLTGQLNVPACPNEFPDMEGLCRWVGGLGHELGHTFGLPHPPGCDQGTCSTFASQSLMYLGYITYPNTYFLQEDKAQLLASEFFSIHNPLVFSADCRGVAAFNFCLQDESNGNMLRFNSDTGEYVFTRCGTSYTLTGNARITVRGCTVTLDHVASDRRILAKVDTCQNKGNVSVQSLSSSASFTIIDRNIKNNSCNCP